MPSRSPWIQAVVVSRSLVSVVAAGCPVRRQEYDTTDPREPATVGLTRYQPLPATAVAATAGTPTTAEVSPTPSVSHAPDKVCPSHHHLAAALLDAGIDGAGGAIERV